jgi:hypothetical protein
MTAPICSVLLDSEGLSMLARRDRRLGAILQRVTGEPAGLNVSMLTVVEAGTGHTPAAMSWALSRTTVHDATAGDAGQALRLLRSAGGLSGHSHAIDAVVAALAARLPGRVVVVTSDPQDWYRLLGGQVTIAAV